MHCVYVCDCVNSKIGEDQSAEDAEDGPPELLVRSHTSLISYGLMLSLLSALH